MSYQNAWSTLPKSLLAASYNYSEKDHIDVINFDTFLFSFEDMQNRKW